MRLRAWAHAAGPPTSADRLAGLDGLRAYAALAVMSVHVFFFGDPAWGTTGVWIFFILSGFLLFRPFAQRDFRFGPGDVASYLVRRVFRVLPLYYVAVGVYWASGIPPYLGEPSWLPLHLTFQRAGGHFWTIKQEMIFYLTLPVIAVACALLPTRRAALALILVLIPVTYVVFDVWGAVVLFGGMGGMLLWVTPFICGMALAFVPDRVDARWGLPLVAVGIAGVVGLNLRPAATFEAYERLLGLPKDGTPFSHPYLVWPFAVTLVLGVSLRPTPIFANPVARAIGVISFGVYLWHGLVVNVVMRVGGLISPWPVYLGTAAGSIAIGAITYWWIERPSMRAGHWLADRIVGRERLPSPTRVVVEPSRAEPT